MSTQRTGALAAALLYEGYALYPYRASSLKNRKRFDFGVLYPGGWSGASGADASSMRTECVVKTNGVPAEAHLTVRFLHLVERIDDGGPAWHEAVERSVTVATGPLSAVGATPGITAFDIPAEASREGTIERRSERLQGTVVVAVERDAADVLRLSVAITNTTPVGGEDRDAALLRALVSTHTLVEVLGAELVSLLDPPDAMRFAVDRCRNVGTWPVLVGEPWERGTMLSSPIILYDHPRIAPESRGDLFDATEIDEILTLRAQTLTDEEKAEAMADPRVRALLARTAVLTEDEIARLHGVLRRGSPTGFRAGERVRLAPSRRADVMDIALDGRTATIVSVEQDFEGRTYLAVTVDDDPGADLGLRGQPGHRFFFHAEEVERLP